MSTSGPADSPTARGPADLFRTAAGRGGRIRPLVPLVLAVAAGGALGAGARFAATVAWPTESGAFPGTVLAVNVLGCFLIGILMVTVVELWPHRRLVRPFLGTGVLGGFTTFSTYAVDVTHLASAGHLATTAAYLVLTPVLAVLSAAVAARATAGLLKRRTR